MARLKLFLPVFLSNVINSRCAWWFISFAPSSCVFREFKPLVENENEKLDPKVWRIVESILFYWKVDLREYKAYKENLVDDDDEDLDSDEDYESSG